MRWKDECLGGAERAPFSIASQHAGKGDGAIIFCGGRGQLFQMGKIFFIGAGAGEDKMRRRVRARRISKRSKCFDQKVASFLHVEATEKEKKMLPAELRKIPEEIFPRAFQIHRGRGSAVLHHALLAMIEGERFAGQTPFLFRSEK